MTILAILGPTASGKSRLAMQVARARIAAGRQTELVAVDAFTIYRGMDIATATPPAAERREVPHHLVDVLEPWEELSVADFQRLARTTIDQVRGRGATPLLVGGSGLYWRAVVDDLRFPPTNDAVRARLEERWGADPAAAHAHLTVVDPGAAARIEPGNLRRTVRALEVIELTGAPFSSFAAAWDRHESVIGDVEVGYLEPPAEVLRATIEERARDMVAAGLLDEARRLRALPRPLSRTAAQAIGYAEAFAVLDGELANDALAGAIARRTWRYARRQRSWFRADPRCHAQLPDEVAARLVAA